MSDISYNKKFCVIEYVEIETFESINIILVFVISIE